MQQIAAPHRFRGRVRIEGDWSDGNLGSHLPSQNFPGNPNDGRMRASIRRLFDDSENAASEPRIQRDGKLVRVGRLLYDRRGWKLCNHLLGAHLYSIE